MPRDAPEAERVVAGAWLGAVVAVVGVPRTGKSRLVKALDARRTWPRRVVFEPHGARDRIERARGRELYPWRGELVTVTALLRHPELLDRDPLSLVVAPDDPAAGAERLAADFSAVARLAWHTGDVTVIAEESALYARGAVAVANLLSTGGAHAGVRLVLLSQRWGRLPIDVRAAVTHLVAFAQGEASDLAALASKCGRPFADRVRGLALGDLPACWVLGAQGATP